MLREVRVNLKDIGHLGIADMRVVVATVRIGRSDVTFGGDVEERSRIAYLRMSADVVVMKWVLILIPCMDDTILVGDALSVVSRLPIMH